VNWLGATNLTIPIVAALVLAGISLWLVPKWQVGNLKIESAEDIQKKLELENEARKTIAQILAGLAVLVTFYYTAKQLSLTQEQVLVTQEAQITERFTRATEQLASDKLEARVGGIYAFQRIARDSDKDLYSVLAILQTFVRENAPREEANEENPPQILFTLPPADIDAAVVSLASLSEHRAEPFSLDLHGTDLEGAAITDGDFDPAYLFNTNLQSASIVGGDLSGADFTASNLRRAYLVSGERFNEPGIQSGTINLSKASFRMAQLHDAEIHGADLSGASLVEATLYRTAIIQVDLSEADFQSAKLDGALLCVVDLRGAKNLTQSQLNVTADGAGVTLPEGLEAPPTWSENDLTRRNQDSCRVPNTAPGSGPRAVG
jgi:uncharacterized protein YjbI with pentapeptide repeats